MRQVGRLALGGIATGFAVALAAGCSGSSQVTSVNAAASPTSGAGRDCGAARSAAHVPVIVQASRGVDCSVALQIEERYSRKLDAGQAPGNGGGGPVPVDGWICEGYPTPQVLRTGRASECHKGDLRFYAVLPAPSTSATP